MKKSKQRTYSSAIFNIQRNFIENMKDTPPEARFTKNQSLFTKRKYTPSVTEPTFAVSKQSTESKGIPHNPKNN